MAKKSLVLEMSFSDVEDLLEDIAGSEACVEVDLELKSPDAAQILSELDPDMAEGVACLLGEVYDKVLEATRELAKRLSEGKRDLATQLSLLSQAYKAYETIEDYFPLAITGRVFRIGDAVIRLIGLETVLSEAPEKVFVIISGPDKLVAQLEKRIREEAEEE